MPPTSTFIELAVSAAYGPSTPVTTQLVGDLTTPARSSTPLRPDYAPPQGWTEGEVAAVIGYAASSSPIHRNLVIGNNGKRISTATSPIQWRVLVAILSAFSLFGYCRTSSAIKTAWSNRARRLAVLVNTPGSYDIIRLDTAVRSVLQTKGSVVKKCRLLSRSRSPESIPDRIHLPEILAHAKTETEPAPAPASDLSQRSSLVPLPAAPPLPIMASPMHMSPPISSRDTASPFVQLPLIGHPPLCGSLYSMPAPSSGYFMDYDTPGSGFRMSSSPDLMAFNPVFPAYPLSSPLLGSSLCQVY